MQLHPDLLLALNQINFLPRYEKIINQSSSSIEECLHSYSVEEVKTLIVSYGYKVSFNKKENFFKILEEADYYQFQFNISLRYGAVELIWDIMKEGKRLEFGWGSWGSVSDIMEPAKKLKTPVFSSYEVLKEILNQVLSIYEDFKQAIVAQSLSSRSYLENT